jgi:hydroxymethylbilane synthase
MREPLRLGTRRSALALAQARQVAGALTAATGAAVELVEITTYGDTSPEPLARIGGTGVFVNALREALLDRRIDLAVHSLKDLPTADPAGIVLAAVPPREDPRDVLVARDGLALAELPPGARVGTGSPRRAAQLRLLGLGLDVVPIRGNVDTRLRYVAEGRLDAVVVARAGLARLGRLDVATEVLDPMQMLPAPGQGALAVECRGDDAHDAYDTAGPGEAGGPADAAHPRDTDLVRLLAGLDDPASRAAATAERSLLAALEAGCAAPVGAYGEPVLGDDAGDTDQESQLYLRAAVIAIDGSASVRLSTTGPLHEADSLGRKLAVELLAEGAATLMGDPVR